MTFIEKFEYLKKNYALKADASKIKDTFIAAQITMSDEDCGGTFYVAYINGILSFEPYDYHDNTVAMIINSNLLEDCIKGKADPTKNYLDGNIQAWGNLDHALQLIDCLKAKKKTTRTKKADAAPVAEKEAVKEKKTCTRKKKADTQEVQIAPEEKTPAKKATSKKKEKKDN